MWFMGIFRIFFAILKAARIFSYSTACHIEATLDIKANMGLIFEISWISKGNFHVGTPLVNFIGLLIFYHCSFPQDNMKYVLCTEVRVKSNANRDRFSR